MTIDKIGQSTSTEHGGTVSSTEKIAKQIVKEEPKTASASTTYMNHADTTDVAHTSSDKNQKVDMEKVKNAVRELNKGAKYTEACFDVHEDTERVMIKIVDKNTKQVVKEFPPEKTLDLIAKAWEIAGIMVDEKS